MNTCMLLQQIKSIHIINMYSTPPNEKKNIYIHSVTKLNVHEHFLDFEKYRKTKRKYERNISLASSSQNCHEEFLKYL